jgi:hypothetical protein
MTAAAQRHPDDEVERGGSALGRAAAATRGAMKQRGVARRSGGWKFPSCLLRVQVAFYSARSKRRDKFQCL